jgi:tetratricopeptide (TPR) repeat protein
VVSAAAEPVGTLEVALAHAVRLLERAPLLAAEQASEILKAAPGHPNATLVLGIARRASGDPLAAHASLAALVASHPRWAAAHCELGLTLGTLGRGEDAVVSLRRAVELEPDLAIAWRALADHLSAMGDDAGADVARGRFLKASTQDPRLLSAAAALCENKIPDAEALLRLHLKEYPTDIAAIRMFAEVAARLGRYRDAENLLARCLELAPGFHGARHNYAVVLFRQAKAADALPEIDRLLAVEPRNPNYRSLKAAILTGVGEYERAIEIYAEVLTEYPHQAPIWLSYGHALKTAGRRQEGIRAYRRTIELDASSGEAYWSLANLKTFRFEPQDLQRMRAQLARPDLKAEDRYHFDFALGKALEDERDYDASFEHYLRGNALRRAEISYEPAQNREHVARSRALFTPQFFAARAGVGVPAPDPIFIVGLPRAGSTLLEQILSSHSLVEGTMELPDVNVIARTLAATQQGVEPARYPEALGSLEPDAFHALGEHYLARTRVQRKRGTPFFIDKMPNNFAHIALIHLMLPNAKIIDARRHPLGCCFSGFKQHFARGQSFTYDLAELGAYYRDYVELMAHFDAVLPGRVHRVFYERMIEDTEGEVRRLLDYCGLQFEPSCLRFYENERAVRTASSEQVRTPIFHDGVDQWRHYEPWLAPLKAALGPLLEAYPGTPDFYNTNGGTSCSAVDLEN